MNELKQYAERRDREAAQPTAKEINQARQAPDTRGALVGRRVERNGQVYRVTGATAGSGRMIDARAQNGERVALYIDDVVTVRELDQQQAA